jgi:CheY-like chemotaxis protein
LLSVTDSGCGIDREVIDNIFDPFFTTKEPDKGTGLGLATVYGIVQQHDGMIHVYSEVDCGTTFKIYLPITDQVPSIKATGMVTKPKGGTETILVAEDDEKVLKLINWILVDAGYTVMTAANGRDAVDIGRKHGQDIDLILLDMIMPELNGIAVYESLLKDFPHMRFIFSSGYSKNVMRYNYLLNKDTELIQKPYSPGTLLTKVREILDRQSISESGEIVGKGENE